MKDLTTGSLVNHMLIMAAPVAVTMLCHIAYQLVDLYFVAKLGAAATAGVSAAVSVGFIVAALSQALGAGTVALISHAAGRKAHADANLIFNQAIVLCAACSAVLMAIIYSMIGPYVRATSSDPQMMAAATTFLLWVLPGCGLTLPMVVLGSSLRGIGIVQPTIYFNVLTVALNTLLAPVLISGWLTGTPLGVAGAGLATTLSVAVGTVLLAMYFTRAQRYLAFDVQLLFPRFAQWYRILRIGLPVGGELVLTFLLAGLVYYIIRDFGTAAQAGYGVGSRVMQIILLPASALAFAVAPIVGQNFGAHRHGRVREALRKSVFMGTLAMTTTAILTNLWSSELVRFFDAGESSSAVASGFLRAMSWAFVAQGLVYICSSVFQGLGNTFPALASAGTCFGVFIGISVVLSVRPDFKIEYVWYAFVFSVSLQAIVSSLLLRVELRRGSRPLVELSTD